MCASTGCRWGKAWVSAAVALPALSLPDSVVFEYSDGDVGVARTGECANCRAPISARYFLVELGTACVFAACWVEFGALVGAPLAMAYCLSHRGNDRRQR